jgi:DNA-binding Xre family transcriptional regulator
MRIAKIRTSELRAQHHMTQAALAHKAKLSKTTIFNLEAGNQTKIGLETIAKLCHALDCSPTELFELKDEKEENVIRLQKEALSPFIGTLTYKKPFKVNELDKDLASITNTKKRRVK